MLEQAREAARTVGGWLTDDEGELLFRLASACPAGGSVVEIGSWHGKSTIWLARGAEQAGARVYAVDPHEQSSEDPSARTFEIMIGNLAAAGVSDLVTPVVARSIDALPHMPERIDLLFVDGDHSADGVRRDIDLYLPRVAVNGTIAFHDVINPFWAGPRRALRRELWRSRDLGRVRIVDSLAYAKKVARASLGDRLGNKSAALLLRLYDFRPASAPQPVLGALRAVARLTPLKSRR